MLMTQEGISLSEFSHCLEVVYLDAENRPVKRADAVVERLRVIDEQGQVVSEQMRREIS
jgi:hypothetical protein